MRVSGHGTFTSLVSLMAYYYNTGNPPYGQRGPPPGHAGQPLGGTQASPGEVFSMSPLDSPGRHPPAPPPAPYNPTGYGQAHTAYQQPVVGGTPSSYHTARTHPSTATPSPASSYHTPTAPSPLSMSPRPGPYGPSQPHGGVSYLTQTKPHVLPPPPPPPPPPPQRRRMDTSVRTDVKIQCQGCRELVYNSKMAQHLTKCPNPPVAATRPAPFKGRGQTGAPATGYPAPTVISRFI